MGNQGDPKMQSVFRFEQRFRIQKVLKFSMVAHLHNVAEVWENLLCKMTIGFRKHQLVGAEPIRFRLA